MSYSASAALAVDCSRSTMIRATDDAIGMPPSGVSPATDLQRQLAEAALRNFYKPTSNTRVEGWGVRRRLFATIAVGMASWVAVFSVGAALTR